MNIFVFMTFLFSQIDNSINQQNPQQNLSMSDQARMRDRIGYFNKNVDNTMVNAPDPTSSHFQASSDRFKRDFAAVEKANRERELKRK